MGEMPPVYTSWLRPDHTHIWLMVLSLELRLHAKSFADWSMNKIFQRKLLPVGVAMTNSHPLPCSHVFNNARPGSWSMTNFGLFSPSV